MKLEPVLNLFSQCGELPSRTEQIDDLDCQNCMTLIWFSLIIRYVTSSGDSIIDIISVR
jgi:hypothetical protein